MYSSKQVDWGFGNAGKEQDREIEGMQTASTEWKQMAREGATLIVVMCCTVCQPKYK
jgi:hypothetical protein